MDKIAFLFPGQGAHFIGMGQSLYNLSPTGKSIFDTIDLLRPETTHQCFEGPKEVLNSTINTQPCIFAVEMAMYKVLNTMGVFPHGVGGFSLGEISALVASEILSLEEGLKLVIARGEAMEKASQSTEATMVAVLKLEDYKVEEIANQFKGAVPVNYNCPKQLVVAISNLEVPDFLAAIKKAGGRGIPLGLSGGFHSFYMDSAVEALESKIESLTCHSPQIPLYGNETATPYSENVESIKKRILSQINHPVLWEKTILEMKKDGFNLFIEVGPGKTLGGFINKIDPSIRNIHADAIIENFNMEAVNGKEWSLECCLEKLL
ncbi:MAG: ACP S-malonyltransferase [Eubacteriaceae bacterium]